MDDARSSPPLPLSSITIISQPPDFNRHLLKGLPPIIVPRLPVESSSSPSTAIRDRVFHFSRKAVQELKARANSRASTDGEVPSFQSLCSQLWRSVTRARRRSPGVETSLGLTTNCRNRMEPPLGTHYFGKAVLPVFAVAKIEEVLGRELSWCSQLLHSNLVAFGDEAVRREMETWKEQKDPSTLGSSCAPFLMVNWSPRFPV